MLGQPGARAPRPARRRLRRRGAGDAVISDPHCVLNRAGRDGHFSHERTGTSLMRARCCISYGACERRARASGRARARTDPASAAAGWPLSVVRDSRRRAAVPTRRAAGRARLACSARYPAYRDQRPEWPVPGDRARAYA